MDDEKGREGRMAIVYVKGDSLAMELLKLGTIGVVHKHKLARLFLS